MDCSASHDGEVLATATLTADEADSYGETSPVDICTPSVTEAGSVDLLADPELVLIALTQDASPASGDKLVCVIANADGSKLTSKLGPEPLRRAVLTAVAVALAAVAVAVVVVVRQQRRPGQRRATSSGATASTPRRSWRASSPRWPTWPAPTATTRTTPRCWSCSTSMRGQAAAYRPVVPDAGLPRRRSTTRPTPRSATSDCWSRVSRTGPSRPRATRWPASASRPTAPGSRGGSGRGERTNVGQCDCTACHSNVAVTREPWYVLSTDVPALGNLTSNR